MEEKLKSIRWLILDVDGTMTDGGVYLNDHGMETKKFNIKDGAGILLARQAGIERRKFSPRRESAAPSGLESGTNAALPKGIPRAICSSANSAVTHSRA